MISTKFKIDCEEENAVTFWQWLKNRGGIALWKSADLSEPGMTWSTPATIRKGDCEGQTGDEIIPYPKVTWKMDPTPEIITDPELVGVSNAASFKEFKVSIRRGGGWSFKLTDASQRKLNEIMKACREKHGDAFYRRGVLDSEDYSMGVYYNTEVVPIREWIKTNKPELL